MTRLFYPARVLLGRLRYAYKIALVSSVLLLPLAVVVKGYVDIQTGQVYFSAKERDGVAYLRPVLDLTVKTVAARNLAIGGGATAAGAAAEVGVPAAAAAIDAATARYGAELDTTGTWSSAKAALGNAQNAASAANTADGVDTGQAKAAYDAYGTAITALLGLVEHASDRSNLTLDPDLDS